MMSNSLLRHIILCGPEWKPGEPLWELAAAAPDAYADIQSPQEDHIHPLRVLTIDTKNSGTGDGFREPRLISIHLLVGHGEGKYATQFSKEKVKSPIHPKDLSWPEEFGKFPKEFNEAKLKDIYVHKDREFLKIHGCIVLEQPIPGQRKSIFLEQKIPSRLKWGLDKSTIFNRDRWQYFETIAFFLSTSVPISNVQSAADFQHVLAKPLVTPEAPWPGEVDEAIEVPKFKLVTGKINLAVAKGAFDWLGSLQPTAVSAPVIGIPRYPLWLTPEGIELQTLVYFPGTAAQLEGYFLLSPIEGKLRLTLLPDKLNESQRSAWNTAWQNVLPKGGDIESLAGFRVEGSLGAIPEFRWTLDIAEVKENIGFGRGFRIVSDTKNLPVEIPSQYLRVDMLSPTRSGTDGVINCTGGYFYLGSMNSLSAIFKDLFGDITFGDSTSSIGKQDPLLLVWSTPKTYAPFTTNIKNQYLKMSAEGTKVGIELVANEGRYSCSFDERRVAHLLRDAYGLPALAPKDSVPNDPIMGFVPLTDGWLQIPLTNYPPLNPDSDSEMLLNTTKPKVNVLDGFLRYSQQQELPQVLSAFNKNSEIESFVKEAPWTVTLEGAENLSIAIVLDKTTPDKTTPINGLARLDNPDISARGLLWLSTDRPDELEAIPRIGAGPGAFIDVPLELKETQEEAKKETYVSIDKIKINVDTANGVLVTREALSLTLISSDFSKPNPTHWARHPRMPLAAQMPMTRSANSAVRPLESCDLFPLELFPVLDKTKKNIAKLIWPKFTTFSELTGDFYQAVSKDWPLSTLDKESPAPVIGVDNALKVRGVGWYAFGVPGTEITFKKGDAWNINESWPLLATYRFDVPLLDTAFALSTLPPTKDEQTRESPSLVVSVPTANNWPELKTHWGEQERRLQNCRVSHSYSSDFKAIDDFDSTDITSLIGGFIWKAKPFGFGNPINDGLPYGHLKIGRDEQLNGNEALKGITKKFKILDDRLEEDENGTIQVLGNSPSSFVLEEYIVDARGSGVKSLVSSNGWWRPIKDFGEKKAGIAGRFTSEKMIEVKAAGDNNFSFWFKDIPLTPKITPTTEALTFQNEDQIDTHAWQDGHIQSSGYEWRLNESKSETLGNGEYRFKFMGFLLEPLQLKSVSFPSTSNCPSSNIPEEVLIVARLHLGAQLEDVDDGGNLVTLTLKNKQGNSDLVLENVTSENSFVFQINTGSSAVKIKAKSVTWDFNKDIFALTKPSITFGFMGSEVVLNNLIDNSTNDGLEFTWEQKPNGPSHGAVYITRAELNIAKDNANNIAKHNTNNVTKGEAKFLFDYTIAIAPGFENSENTGSTVTIEVKNESLDSSVHKGKFSILGSSAQVDIIPSKNAFSVISKDQTPLTGSLIDGFPNSANICFGLISTIDAFDADASAKILSGVLSGKINYPKASDQSRTHFHLDYAYLSVHLNQRNSILTSNKPDYWTGSLSLFGTVKGRSAIAWPEIISGDENPTSIPFPPTDKSGLKSVKISNISYTHDVEWILDGHILPLEIARHLFFGDNKEGVWTTQAVAKHTIKNSQKTLEFSSVDSLIVGVVGAFIPKWSTSLEDKNLNSTFAARYKNQNPLAKNIPDPGMAWPGRGGLGTVLQGTWSSAFREDFRAHHDQVVGLDKKMVLTGGFLGLVYQTEEHAPLVRLPVLMGLSEGILQANGDVPLISQKGIQNDATYKLPWPDSLAAAPVAVTFRSAVTPSSESEKDLEATIHHGAKSLLANSDEWHRTSSSLLVEQSFPVAYKAGDLSKAPYFLSSAAAITRLLGSEREESTINTLSVVSSTFTHIDKVTQALKHFNKVAVLLRSLTQDQESNSTQANKTPNIPATLFSVGDDVVAWEWPGLVFDGPETNDILNSQATSKAFTFHAHPLVAMMCDSKGNFRRVTLPLPKIKPQKRAVLDQTFSDSGRGYKLPVRETKTMAGVEEGGVQAVRDDDQENKDSSKKYKDSGIAGLTHKVNLPSSAAEMKSNNELVWITQQRAPIYLPLQSKITSEPIPWLVPARPLTRVPLSEEIYKKLPGVQDTHKKWQPVVAEQLITASISERPGVLMANQLRLEMASSAEAVFDPLHPKFGQAAQSSSSFIRTVRTPRPAKLPVNTGDELRDRRPCVSSLYPEKNHDSWLGPADTIRGKSKSGDEEIHWSVTLVASPETAGIVIPSWDGSIRLTAQISEKRKCCPSDWATEFKRLLMLDASACLAINGYVLNYKRVRLEPTKSPVDCQSENGNYQGEVSIILDMHPNQTNLPGPVVKDIEQLLTGTHLNTRIELHITVIPSSNLNENINLVPDNGETLDLKTNQNNQISNGASRPPVTLRFPLWVVMRDRGALALEPSTLIFTDPAYNAGLSAPPYDESVRVTGEGIPLGRGALYFVLSADRRRVNRQGSVVLMPDLRFEKKLDAVTSGADFEVDSDVKVEVKFVIQPRTGERRRLLLHGNTKSTHLILGNVHELDFTTLTELDGNWAYLTAGDVLEISVESAAMDNIKLTNVIDTIQDKSEWKLQNSAVLRLTLTNEPIVEPPSALYAALLLKGKNESNSLSLPLYAQSPLPWRVDIEDAAADFRAGLIRRKATFVWHLLKPFSERTTTSSYIVKWDRNGQTYLPAVIDEFNKSRNMT
jgi:hypothetical protein